MQYTNYEIFDTVVETKSLSKAADLLGYSQSNVTHVIQQLEKDFDITLLIRNKSGVYLTENGKIILKQMQAVLEEERKLQQLVTDMNHLKTGTLRIGIFSSVAVELLPGILKDFHTKYPDIQVKLIDGDYAELQQYLLEDRVDFAFISQSIPLKVNFIPLCQDKMMATLPLDHPLKDTPLFPLEQFKEEHFVYPYHTLSYDVEYTLKLAKIKPHINYEVKGDDAIVSMVRNGLGVAILPSLFLRSHKEGIAIKPLDPPIYRTIGVGLPVHRTNTKIADIFIDLLKETLKDEIF